MPEIFRVPLFFLANAALLFSAAKAHGRQMRLEREARGIFEVSFGGGNPAWVEWRWAAERRWFWIAYPFVALLAWQFMGRPGGAPRIGLALYWAFCADLSLLGAVSVLRLWRYLASENIAEKKKRNSTWLSRALWGSVGWWILVGILAALIGF